MSNATARAGQRSDLDASDVSFAVNMAWEEISSIQECALMEKIAVSSATSGQNRIELPEDFSGIINISITTSDHGSGKTLTRVSASRVDESGFDPIGRPQRYVLYNNWLELHPSPDSGYSLQLRYTSFATDLVELTQVPSCTTAWRKAILYLAEAEIRALTNDLVGEAAARQRVFNYVNQLKADEARRQRDESGMRASHTYQDIRQRSQRSFDVV